jgi:hypothetical protein
MTAVRGLANGHQERRDVKTRILRVLVVAAALALSNLSFLAVKYVHSDAAEILMGSVVPSTLVLSAILFVFWTATRRLWYSAALGIATYLALGIPAFGMIAVVAKLPFLLVMISWPTMVPWVFGCDLPWIGFCMN